MKTETGTKQPFQGLQNQSLGRPVLDPVPLPPLAASPVLVFPLAPLALLLQDILSPNLPQQILTVCSTQGCLLSHRLSNSYHQNNSRLLQTLMRDGHCRLHSTPPLCGRVCGTPAPVHRRAEAQKSFIVSPRVTQPDSEDLSPDPLGSGT